MDRREELIANILKHVTIVTRSDSQGQQWNILQIRKQIDDDLLYETQLIPGTGAVQSGDLYIDIALLKLFDEHAQEQPKVKIVPRIKRVK